MDGIWFQQQRYLRASRPRKIMPLRGFVKNLPLSLKGERIFHKNLAWAKPFFLKLLKPDTIHTGSATA